MDSAVFEGASVLNEHSSPKLPAYVLITPARNEARFIELTLQSMISQTVPPLRWVIVSDGSTDGTDDIVRNYAADHPWIVLIRMPERAERHFAGKVHAFNAGYESVKDLPIDIVGNLDGDVSFGSGHFEFLIDKMAQNPRLGVAGAPFREGTFSTTIGLAISRMSGVDASFSGVPVSTRSVAIYR